MSPDLMNLTIQSEMTNTINNEKKMLANALSSQQPP